MKKHHIDRVYVAGLALDFCVSWTAKDAVSLGYESYVVVDASMHIGETTLKKAETEWRELGVKKITVRELTNQVEKK